jgi:hypothetical protein
MKKFNFFFVSCLLATSMFFVAGCETDDSSDPLGTMVNNIRNDVLRNPWSGTYFGAADIGIGALGMSQSNVFFNSTLYGGAMFEIAYVGTVKGLGSIKSIPNENLFTGEVAAIERGGYVLRGTDTNNRGKYARLYVVRFLTGANSGGIIGAQIKYQYPFEP